jgi:DNA topoisomerase I
MDRLMGYNLSPLLWKKVKAGLSAGRVQSVAMRIICEREDEIDKFTAEEYWEMDIVLGKDHHHFPARLVKYKDVRIESIPDKAGTDKIIEELKTQKFLITDTQEKPIRRKPYPPYTTSKLQQDAVNRLGYTAKKTMQLAQQLYEGVQLKSEGLTGLITYMRTDSTRVSAAAIEQARQFVTDAFGRDYIPETPNVYASGKQAQDAHEAVRPTSVFRTPESLQDSLDKQQLRLYKIIWERFVASQMSESITKNVQVTVNAGDYILMISGSRVQFLGFNKVYSAEAKEVMVRGVEKLVKGDEMSLEKVEGVQKFTQPPPRFTDATLVKELEESGIGRPSTYAPTISTILNRYYVVRSGKQLVPTQLGKIVNKLLVENFPEILNINFTARMEKELDDIADNNRDWIEAVRDFYTPFSIVMEKAHANIDKLDFKTDEKTDLICEKCGSPMIKKLGRYGYFLACSAFPKCRNIKSIPLGKCPRKACEGDIVKKKGQRGRSFFGCTKYPECTFTTYNEILETPCPKCGKILVKFPENRVMYKKCLNEECQYKEILEK